MSSISNARKGALLALSGSLLWGVMGVTSQYLLHNCQLPPLWIVHVRMLFGGLLLLIADCYTHPRELFQAWHTKRDLCQLMIFSFITIMWVQYAYLSSVNYMNAAMATVFVSLAPIMTILWVSLRHWKRPLLNEAVCCVSAVLGAIVMATHGDMTTLSISREGLFWGIMLPFAGVVYTVQPGYLMKSFRPANVTGWGLVIGGLCLTPVVPFWHVPVELDALGWFTLIYTVVCGTSLAFWTFLTSLRYIKPHIAAIYELIEPFSAIVLSIIILDIAFELPEWLGTFLIITPVIYLSLIKKG